MDKQIKENRIMTEYSLIGAMFLVNRYEPEDSPKYDRKMVYDTVEEDDFVCDECKVVFKAMKIIDRQTPYEVDPCSVMDMLGEMGSTVTYRQLRDMIQAPFSSEHIMTYADMVSVPYPKK